MRVPSRLTLAATACAILLAGCASDPESPAADPAPAATDVTAAPSPTGSSAPAGDPLRVVASTNVYGDIASRIGGDRVQVTSIISDPTQDPHSYEANTRTQLALSEARLVITNGGGYDDFVGTMLSAAPNDSRTLLDAVEVSGRKADGGEELNEHVWYDLKSVDLLAERIADALAQAEPATAPTFRANADAFRAELATLVDREADLKSGHQGTKVAITEPVPVYLLESCGLENVTPEEFSEAIEEGTDVPARVLADTLALIESGDVKALMYNEQTAGVQTEQLRKAAEAENVPIVEVTETLPAGMNYLSWMGSNLDAVRDALSDERT